MNNEDIVATVMHFFLSQSIKQCLEFFGTRGKEATRELIQFHSMDVLIPMMAKELTPEQKKQAIASLVFLVTICYWTSSLRAFLFSA